MKDMRNFDIWQNLLSKKNCEKNKIHGLAFVDDVIMISKILEKKSGNF